MPVTLPLGRARLSTRPASTGSDLSAHHNDGNRLGRIFGRPDQEGLPSPRQDDIDLETHQFGRKLGEPIDLTFRISVFEGDVLSFDVAQLAQSRPNCLGTGGRRSWIGAMIDTRSAGLSSAAARDPRCHRLRE